MRKMKNEESCYLHINDGGFITLLINEWILWGGYFTILMNEKSAKHSEQGSVLVQKTAPVFY